jgi:hypothetical protein
MGEIYQLVRLWSTPAEGSPISRLRDALKPPVKANHHFGAAANTGNGQQQATAIVYRRSRTRYTCFGPLDMICIVAMAPPYPRWPNSTAISNSIDDELLDISDDCSISGKQQRDDGMPYAEWDHDQQEATPQQTTQARRDGKGREAFTTECMSQCGRCHFVAA